MITKPIYCASALIKEKIQFYFATARFPRFFESFGSYPIFLNEFLLFSTQSAEIQQISGDKLEGMIQEFNAWYQKLFLPTKLAYAKDKQLDPKTHKKIDPITKSPLVDNTYILIEDHFWRFLPSSFQQLCQGSGYNLFFDLYQLCTPQIFEKIRTEIPARIMPHFIDLLLCFLRGSNEYIILTTYEDLPLFEQAIHLLDKISDFGKLDNLLQVELLTPQEFIQQYASDFGSLEKFVESPFDAELYSQLDLISPGEIAEGKTKIFPSTATPQDMTKIWQDLSYITPVLNIYANILSTATRLHAATSFEIDPQSLILPNKTPPVIFILTPKVWYAFLTYFYLDSDRIPTALYLLAKQKYLRFAVFEEYLYHPDIDPRFIANFHTYFNPIYLPQIAGEMLQNRESEENIITKIYENTRQRWKICAKTIRPLPYEERAKFGQMVNIIGSAKEKALHPDIFTLQDAIHYMIEHFQIHSAFLSDDTATLAFTIPPKPMEDQIANSILYIPPDHVNPLFPQLKSAKNINRHLNVHGMSIFPEIYNDALILEMPTQYQLDALLEIPIVIENSIETTVQIHQTNQALNNEIENIDENEKESDGSENNERFQVNNAYIDQYLSRPFPIRLTEAFENVCNTYYPELKSKTSKILAKVLHYIPPFQNEASVWAEIYQLIKIHLPNSSRWQSLSLSRQIVKIAEQMFVNSVQDLYQEVGNFSFLSKILVNPLTAENGSLNLKEKQYKELEKIYENHHWDTFSLPIVTGFARSCWDKFDHSSPLCWITALNFIQPDFDVNAYLKQYFPIPLSKAELIRITDFFSSMYLAYLIQENPPQLPMLYPRIDAPSNLPPPNTLDQNITSPFSFKEPGSRPKLDKAKISARCHQLGITDSAAIVSCIKEAIDLYEKLPLSPDQAIGFAVLHCSWSPINDRHLIYVNPTSFEMPPYDIVYSLISSQADPTWIPSNRNIWHRIADISQIPLSNATEYLATQLIPQIPIPVKMNPWEAHFYRREMALFLTWLYLDCYEGLLNWKNREISSEWIQNAFSILDQQFTSMKLSYITPPSRYWNRPSRLITILLQQILDEQPLNEWDIFLLEKFAADQYPKCLQTLTGKEAARLRLRHHLSPNWDKYIPSNIQAKAFLDKLYQIKPNLSTLERSVIEDFISQSNLPWEQLLIIIQEILTDEDYYIPLEEVTTVFNTFWVENSGQSGEKFDFSSPIDAIYKVLKPILNESLQKLIPQDLIDQIPFKKIFKEIKPIINTLRSEQLTELEFEKELANEVLDLLNKYLPPRILKVIPHRRLVKFLTIRLLNMIEKEIPAEYDPEYKKLKKIIKNMFSTNIFSSESNSLSSLPPIPKTIYDFRTARIPFIQALEQQIPLSPHITSNPIPNSSSSPPTPNFFWECCDRFITNVHSPMIFHVFPKVMGKILADPSYLFLSYADLFGLSYQITVKILDLTPTPANPFEISSLSQDYFQNKFEASLFLPLLTEKESFTTSPSSLQWLKGFSYIMSNLGTEVMYAKDKWHNYLSEFQNALRTYCHIYPQIEGIAAQYLLLAQMCIYYHSLSHKTPFTFKHLGITPEQYLVADIYFFLIQHATMFKPSDLYGISAEYLLFLFPNDFTIRGAADRIKFFLEQYKPSVALEHLPGHFTSFNLPKFNSSTVFDFASNVAEYGLVLEYTTNRHRYPFGPIPEEFIPQIQKMHRILELRNFESIFHPPAPSEKFTIIPTGLELTYIDTTQPPTPSDSEVNTRVSDGEFENTFATITPKKKFRFWSKDSDPLTIADLLHQLGTSIIIVFILFATYFIAERLGLSPILNFSQIMPYSIGRNILGIYFFITLGVFLGLVVTKKYQISSNSPISNSFSTSISYSNTQTTPTFLGYSKTQWQGIVIWTMLLSVIVTLTIHYLSLDRSVLRILFTTASCSIMISLFTDGKEAYRNYLHKVPWKSLSVWFAILYLYFLSMDMVFRDRPAGDILQIMITGVVLCIVLIYFKKNNQEKIEILPTPESQESHENEHIDWAALTEAAESEGNENEKSSFAGILSENEKIELKADQSISDQLLELIDPVGLEIFCNEFHLNFHELQTELKMVLEKWYQNHSIWTQKISLSHILPHLYIILAKNMHTLDQDWAALIRYMKTFGIPLDGIQSKCSVIQNENPALSAVPIKYLTRPLSYDISSENLLEKSKPLLAKLNLKYGDQFLFILRKIFDQLRFNPKLMRLDKISNQNHSHLHYTLLKAIYLAQILDSQSDTLSREIIIAKFQLNESAFSRVVSNFPEELQISSDLQPHYISAINSSRITPLTKKWLSRFSTQEIQVFSTHLIQTTYTALKQIELYTDGSYYPEKKIGAYGYVMIDQSSAYAKQLSTHIEVVPKETSSNEMEFRAVHLALNDLIENLLIPYRNHIFKRVKSRSSQSNNSQENKDIIAQVKSALQQLSITLYTDFIAEDVLKEWNRRIFSTNNENIKEIEHLVTKIHRLQFRIKFARMPTKTSYNEDIDFKLRQAITNYTADPEIEAQPPRHYEKVEKIPDQLNRDQWGDWDEKKSNFSTRLLQNNDNLKDNDYPWLTEDWQTLRERALSNTYTLEQAKKTLIEMGLDPDLAFFDMDLLRNSPPELWEHAKKLGFTIYDC